MAVCTWIVIGGLIGAGGCVGHVAGQGGVFAIRAADAPLPLMIHESVFNITEKINEDGFKACLDEGKRTVLNFGTSFPAKTQAGWNNSIQAYAEGKESCRGTGRGLRHTRR